MLRFIEMLCLMKMYGTCYSSRGDNVNIGTFFFISCNTGCCRISTEILLNSADISNVYSSQKRTDKFGTLSQVVNKLAWVM